MKEPYSFCPIDPGSLALLEDMYDQLLPHFSSRLFNVGLDETWDLGEGRSKEICDQKGKGAVYLDFLKQIHALVTQHGRTMQFWSDIIVRDEPELVAELPRDVIALEWGYEADYPFAEHARLIAKSGRSFYVCPGTSSWNTLAGRTDNALGNLRNAAVNGFANGAIGYLNTDWGDNGHMQPLPVSYLGYLAGAAMSWNVGTRALRTRNRTGPPCWTRTSSTTAPASWAASPTTWDSCIGLLGRESTTARRCSGCSSCPMPCPTAAFPQDSTRERFDEAEAYLDEVAGPPGLDQTVLRRRRVGRRGVRVGRRHAALGVPAGYRAPRRRD